MKFMVILLVSKKPKNIRNFIICGILKGFEQVFLTAPSPLRHGGTLKFGARCQFWIFFGSEEWTVVLGVGMLCHQLFLCFGMPRRGTVGRLTCVRGINDVVICMHFLVIV